MTPRQSELHNVYEIDIHIFKLGENRISIYEILHL